MSLFIKIVVARVMPRLRSVADSIANLSISVPEAMCNPPFFLPLVAILCTAIATARTVAQEPPADGKTGVPVAYQVPGKPGETYRVTLAIVDPKNPDWIISQFVSGVPQTITAENGGKFSAIWDGLDDNFMPVPPGDYAVKGIYMPAQQWHVDNEWHSVTPKFTTGASSWMPSPDDWKTPLPFSGDPVNSPMDDVAVGPNGVAVFYYQYLENGRQNPMLDLKKPIGYDQFIRAFNSGGAGGGTATATDGETVWSFCNEGGPKYVYRADQKPFGRSDGAHRTNGYLPEGWVTSMAAWRDGEKPFVAVAQRGKITSAKEGNHTRHRESATEPVNKITLHEGEGGRIVSELPLPGPQSITIKKGVLYALHTDGAGLAVSSVKVGAGVAQGKWQRVFAVPATIAPYDMDVDSRGRFYLSDDKANHVYQLDATGKVVATFGKLAAQKPGTYDPGTFMMPGKMATWVDAEGNDRLLVVERAGHNRVSEWSADGKLLREFLNLQTKANTGWTVDPERPEHVYIPGHQAWLTRFHVDYAKRTWTVDAVWPLRDDPRAPDLRKPRAIRASGRLYLAGTGGAREGAFNVYRLADDGWKLSASILRVETETAKKKTATYFLWHDANNNDRVDDEEMAPTELPGTFFVYHGQNWSEDLAFLAIGTGGKDVWRLAPSGFDPHGNPIFKEWQKVLTDPVFVARAAKKADSVHGGNELAESFASDWMQADGTPAEGFYVQARGGPNFSANEGPQHKISRYVPDGAGGFRLKWRTGRTALKSLAKPGEIYGAMRIQKPINGLIPVVDQSRCGVLLYTEDGLYVDTIFPDGRKFRPEDVGIYEQGGEFFAGFLYPNKSDGKIYLGMGKYTPLLFEAEGWSMKENPARPLTTLQTKVTIAASQIAKPPEIALTLRGGAGAAKFARVSPALGGAVMDGSMSGWESAQPVTFEAAKDQTVEVRCLYDPEHIYLRWHARLPAKSDPKPLPPLERIFTHDQLADTLSFYIQGDVNAKPGGKPEGRPGDARFVFGIFKKGEVVQPVAVGMYPHWSGKSKPSPQVYRTPVGTATFAHVGAVEGAQLFHKPDADGKGFVFVAALPRTAIPMMNAFAGGLRTLMNFEATFGGHSKFWWADSDGSANRETYDEPSEARLYPGSWASAEFIGLETGVNVRNWLVCGPFGGPGAEKFSWNPNGKVPGTNKDQKEAVREFFETATYPPDDGKVDVKARFTGDLIKGWWPDPKAVIWKRAEIMDLDTRVEFSDAAQLWYGATWIHVPAATELEFQFLSNPQSYLRWTLNGEAVPIKPAEYKENGPNRRRVASRTLTLRAGWNQVGLRGFCTGYDLLAGLSFNGPPEKLWTLKLSATPPDVTSDVPLRAQ
jgi:hypothetical protein